MDLSVPPFDMSRTASRRTVTVRVFIAGPEFWEPEHGHPEWGGGRDGWAAMGPGDNGSRISDGRPGPKLPPFLFYEKCRSVGRTGHRPLPAPCFFQCFFARRSLKSQTGWQRLRRERIVLLSFELLSIKDT